jgi:hypothetical protein
MADPYRDVVSAPAAGVYRVLESMPCGLSPADVITPRARYGVSELPKARRTSRVRRFGRQFTDMFAVLLLAAAGISFLAYVLQRPRDLGAAQLGVAILAVVLLNAVIGFAQECAAERTVQVRIPWTGRRSLLPAPTLFDDGVVRLRSGGLRKGPNGRARSRTWR